MIRKLGGTIRNGSSIYHDSHDLLLEDLSRAVPEAIGFLSGRILKFVSRISRLHGLPHEDEEELHSDVLVIFIQNIRNGKYRNEGNDPVTYAMEIAKRRAFDYRRRKSREMNFVPVVPEDQDFDPDWAGSEKVGLLAELLQLLDESCYKLIRLKYLEGWSDKEAVAERLTPYSTVNALKVHRSMCMKKLSSMAKSLLD